MKLIQIFLIPVLTYIYVVPAAAIDNRLLPRNVCEKGGCSCGPDPAKVEEVTTVECNCEDTVGASTDIFRIKSSRPKKMNTFVLKKCKRAVLDTDLFVNHNLDTLVIEGIEELSIMERSLKSVKNLKIANVGSIQLERNALSYLQAEKVEFNNVTIAKPSIPEVHSEIHPEKVTSHFIFNNSRLLSGVSLKVSYDGKSDFLMGFYNSEIDMPDVVEVACSRFEMIGNNFIETWTQARVKYNKQVVLRSNSLANNELPDVTIDYANPVFELLIRPVERKISKATYRKWFEALGLTDDGKEEGRNEAACFKSRGNQSVEHKITCQDLQSMRNFMKSDGFFQLFFRENRHFEGSASGSAPGLIHLSVEMILILFFHYCLVR